ncbi:GrpB family protein [Cryptosporangium arvum]|uniref:GrpB family protein n=1 Tax=Cryptosporangium arvum DSM 44712 TaxID=927661 RepID=A0A010ZUK5_9ACTN|nr:GrpB family protein [Cryptosporangium arvum]EXG82364.1 hypothetical protein CryarDRAFT_3542 [Cryptosporangium arvum DSM 44712]
MSGAVPAWAHEKAKLHSYNTEWVGLARAESGRLSDLLAPWLVDGVEHVGSTAVPGLAAKPIVDLMASVRDMDGVVGHCSRDLLAAGWSYVPPELDRRPWRRFFVKPDAAGKRRVAHLHVITAGHARWAEQLAFRDALRRNERLAQEYEILKRRLSEVYGSDREAYTRAKSDFIRTVLRR